MGWFLPSLKRASRSDRRTSRPRKSTSGLSPYHRRLVCETLKARRLLAHNILVATGGSVSIPAAAPTFSDSSDVTIDPSAFALAVANIDLQATNNITFQNAVSVASGIALTAQGENSIIVNANVATTTAVLALDAGSGGVVVALPASGTPLTTQGFNATSQTLSLTLGFAPTTGTQFTVIDNTATPAGSTPILGTFSNLPQGGTISATFSSTTYYFTANYAGGDGNDLVLTATNTKGTPSVGLVQPGGHHLWHGPDSTQLDATANVSGTTLPGTFVYTPASGTFLRRQ